MVLDIDLTACKVVLREKQKYAKSSDKTKFGTSGGVLATVELGVGGVCAMVVVTELAKDMIAATGTSSVG